MPGLRYLGHGVPGRQEFIPGVPARDLTDAEATAFREVIEEHRRNTGRRLYGPPLPLAEEPRQGGPVSDAPVADPGGQPAGKRARMREGEPAHDAGE